MTRTSTLARFGSFCFLFTCAAMARADDKAATIFWGGSIVTVDPARPEVVALAVNRDGRIMARGVESFATHGPSTQCIALRGLTLMPGFIEPHAHVIGVAYFQHLMTDLSSFTVPMHPGTIEEIQAALRDALKNPLYRTQKGKWLLAFGVDPSRATPFMASSPFFRR